MELDTGPRDLNLNFAEFAVPCLVFRIISQCVVGRTFGNTQGYRAVDVIAVVVSMSAGLIGNLIHGIMCSLQGKALPRHAGSHCLTSPTPRKDAAGLRRIRHEAAYQSAGINGINRNLRIGEHAGRVSNLVAILALHRKRTAQ